MMSIAAITHSSPAIGTVHFFHRQRRGIKNHSDPYHQTFQIRRAPLFIAVSHEPEARDVVQFDSAAMFTPREGGRYCWCWLVLWNVDDPHMRS